jgi:hypothetical protein
MAHLGVDPGGKGAWALLDDKGALIASEHLPLDPEGFVDAAALLARWRDLGIERATIERVGHITRIKGRAMGIKGRFNFGMNAGVPKSVLQILGVPFDYVDPTVWKPATGVSADKDTSLAAARGLWPDHAGTTFRRKLDVDRAEAALIARYGMRAGTAKKVVSDASTPLSLALCTLVRTTSASRVRTSTRRGAA